MRRLKLKALVLIALGTAALREAPAQQMDGCAACFFQTSCPGDNGQSHCNSYCPGTHAGCSGGPTPTCPLGVLILCLP
jgi:hypothetical protein